MSIAFRFLLSDSISCSRDPTTTQPPKCGYMLLGAVAALYCAQTISSFQKCTPPPNNVKYMTPYPLCIEIGPPCCAGSLRWGYTNFVVSVRWDVQVDNTRTRFESKHYAMFIHVSTGESGLYVGSATLNIL
jgi:hypothetical protein